MPIRLTMSGRATALIMWAGVALLSIAAIVFNPFDKTSINLWLGVVVLFLTLQPMSRWLCAPSRKTVPILELHLAFYAACFGIAAFVTPSALRRVALLETDYTFGLVMVLVGAIMLRLGYHLSRTTGGRIAWLLCPRLPANGDRTFPAILYPVSLVVSLGVAHFHITAFAQPAQLIRQFAFAWLLCAAFAGTLPRVLTLSAFLIVLPIEFALFGGIAGGQLAGLLIYGELLAVIFVLYKHRIPTAIPLIVIGLFLFLQPGKNAYRGATWGQNFQNQDKPGVSLLFRDAAQQTNYSNGENALDSLNDAYLRINDLYVTAAASSAARSRDLYLHGSTYTPLLTTWIPRAIWPGKPKQDFGNSWAKLYGMLGRNDYATSYNLPWLPEMYLNFGWPGVVLISLAIGWVMGELKRGVINRATTPAGVAFAVSMASAFFWPESNLSMMFGGVIIGWITVSILAIGLRTFLYQRARPPQSMIV